MRLFKELYRKLLPNNKYLDYLRKTGVQIGQECEIYKGVSFGSEPYLISIGNHVRINEGVQLVTHDGGMWVLRYAQEYSKIFKDADKFGKIVIGDNVHIGTNSIIMPGVTIGMNSIIGCGAVVTKDVPDNSIVAGVPAKVIESLDEYARKQEGVYVNTKHMSQKEKKEFIIKNFIGMSRNI